MKLPNVLDVLFPKRCVGCGRLGKYFCDSCIKMIQIILETEAICPMCGRPALDGRTHTRCQTQYSIDGLNSFFRYDGVVREAIKAIKYRLTYDIASEFVRIISQKALPQYKSHNLMPIPLHVSRLRERGFNQAEVLGKFVADRLHVSMRTDLLKRIKKTTPQVEMKDRDKRLKNMTNVFDVNKLTIRPARNASQSVAGGQYNNTTILLFDDVFTTGATMRSAADALKRAGARHVWAVTMAR